MQRRCWKKLIQKMKSEILILVLIVLPCFATSQNAKKESFEGVLTYKSEIVFRNKNSYYQEYFGQKYGDTLKVYYNKKGDILRQFLNSGERGYDFNLYLQSENNYYAKWKNLDTLYYYNTTENALDKINETRGKSGKIQGKKCKYISIEGKDPIGKQIVKLTYHYSGEPYLDSKLYTGFIDFFTAEILSEANSPFIKLEQDMGDYILTYILVAVERKKIGDFVFQLPDDYPKKKN